MILACPGNEALGESLLRALPADAIAFELRRFPDGETYLRIDSEVRGRDIVVACTLHDPDAHALPLVFISDTLRELGAATIGLVAPYLAYMRQDRRFQPGEALTSASFARLLSAKFDWLVAVDPHLHRRHSLNEIYRIPTEVVHIAPLLSAWIRAQVDNPLLIGPDAESEQWVSAVAAAVPCASLVLSKVRHGDREVAVSMVPDMWRWAQYTPVLVDDIVSSAHTMIEAVKPWVAAGLRAPVCVAIHGVFAGDACQKLRDAGAARVVTTNSIVHEASQIDVGPLLVEPVRRLLSSKGMDAAPARIPVAVSARHVHLRQATIERLFGAGHRLQVRSPLWQGGQYAAEETVALIGPHGRLTHVRVVGPPRLEDQAEVSRSDEVLLGVDAPVRESGVLDGTPGIVIEGPAGTVMLTRGVICALRHLHMSPADAEVLGLKDHDRVEVAVEGTGRRLIFGDVVVRVSPEFRLELHLDTDEGNAAGLHTGEDGLLMRLTDARARIL
jgi:ribose-phosphate pyrophosphokinase